MINKKQPLVTIVTVSYNAVSLIEKTILSVLNQDYANIEYLVIDGGSTDGTVDIIRKYADRLSFWISEPDKGIYDAMNKGVLHASGEWINFRNCGDYFVSTHAVSDMFQKEVSDDVILLHGDCRMEYEDGFKDMQPPILYRGYEKGMPIFHPSTFIRSSYHKSHLYSLKYRSSSDYQFIYQVMDKGLKVIYRPILIASYNAVQGFSLTHWKLEHHEIWDWKYPRTWYRPFCEWIDLQCLVFKRQIVSFLKFLKR